MTEPLFLTGSKLHCTINKKKKTFGRGLKSRGRAICKFYTTVTLYYRTKF